MPALRPRRVVIAASAALALLVLGFAALAPAHPSRPIGLGRCPSSTPALLPADALARAVDAALAQAPQHYAGIDLTGVRAVQAQFARYGVGPSARAVSKKCGRLVRQRTVLVWLFFPAMRPSASLSQGVVAVSLIGGEYKVWALLH